MIYEFRTYTIRPGTLPTFLSLFGAALPRRETFSPLAAFWYTEIGPLNEVIHVWPYENANERVRLRAEAVKDGSWPPKTGELIVSMKAEIFDVMPFGEPLITSNDGPYFEMTTYTLKPFTLSKMIERWALNNFQSNKPLGVFASDVGELNKWMYIRPYKDLSERTNFTNGELAEEHASLRDSEIVLQEETKLLLPAPFSRIR